MAATSARERGVSADPSPQRPKTSATELCAPVGGRRPVGRPDDAVDLAGLVHEMFHDDRGGKDRHPLIRSDEGAHRPGSPFVPQFDQAFNNAMSLAIAQTFWIGVGPGAVAVVVALFMRELPLRKTNAAPAPAAAQSGGTAADQRRPPLPTAD